MPSFFSRRKDKKAKKDAPVNGNDANDQESTKQQWEDAWTRTSVEPEEVQELLRGCTVELKSRGLDIPFLLLPFRPTSDPSAARTFVRNFCNAPWDRGEALHGLALAQELRLTEPMVLCSVLKWCWSRLSGGVVSWEAYELFRQGEQDSNMARDSFATFIPLSVDSDARTKIIFDFFDLLSAIAAHGKTNGLGGRKLSRLAGWWAFEHEDTGSGFDGGYKNWTLAADATSHLFFAYLRSLSPDSVQGMNGISTLPSSLQRLVQETEYPPERPTLLQTRTTKVVMIVDSVSPTPFALLRRTNRFQYRAEDRALQEFSDYDDPSKALTDECRRVLNAISSTNQSQASSSIQSPGLINPSWSRFEDVGFSSALNEVEDIQFDGEFIRRTPGLSNAPRTKTLAGGRPTTPSWADFLNVGFVDEKKSVPPLLLPPDKILPPIKTDRGHSSQSHHPRLEGESNLEPGELASITRFDLDDAFWWVWISSLAGEEPAERKASFGRCAVVETLIRGGKWLVMEEMVKGAAPEPDPTAYIAEKKGIFSWGKKHKTVSRSKSTSGNPPQSDRPQKFKPAKSQAASKVSIGTDQHARIQAAAAHLQQRQRLQERLQMDASLQSVGRRGRSDDDAMTAKTSSVFTLQPVMMKEASPAMKWANKYDKDAIREAYLANNEAGRGLGVATMRRQEQDNGRSAEAFNRNSLARAAEKPARQELPTPPAEAETPPKAGVPGPASPAPLPPTPRLENGHGSADQAARTELPGSIKSPAMHSPPAPTQPTHQPEPNLEQKRAERPGPRDMRSPTPDQTSKHNKLKKEKKEGGFRRLFSRKKNPIPPRQEEGLRSESPANTLSSLQPGGATIGRRFSGFRQNVQDPTPDASPDYDRAMNHTPAGERAVDYGDVTPLHETRSDEHSPHESLSRVDTDDADEVRREFSNFDQGPLQDQPAFVPEDSPRDSMVENDDVVGEDLTKEPSPAQDRWAQIRKDAATRTAARQSEERSRVATRTLPGDDAETSGEETIESRVARIKARVAELTGNLDLPPASGSPPAPQS